jgi:methylenetetrahydrofolate dehydrogenase (NADP+)/methenyltetrahydrofolate cyclohydrolase
MTVIMSGKAPFEETKKRVKREAVRLSESGVPPGLAAVIVSDDPMTEKYVSMKQRDCKEVGIHSEVHNLSDTNPRKREKALINTIHELNEREDITGILVQMPFPDYIDKNRPFLELMPEKDVDGLTPMNRGILMTEYDLDRDLIPCTAAGIVELLDYYGVGIEGKDAVIIGRSDLVGKPLRILLEDRNATSICCHTRTKAKPEKIGSADIVISAAGRPPEVFGKSSFKLKGDMVRQGVAVVCVGARRHPETGKVHFDVDFESVKPKASFITPNIGGVGPMTRGRLLWNTIIATQKVASLS